MTNLSRRLRPRADRAECGSDQADDHARAGTAGSTDPRHRRRQVEREHEPRARRPAGHANHAAPDQPAPDHAALDQPQSDRGGRRRRSHRTGVATSSSASSGYDGAHSDQPYSLRVRVTDPIQEPVCTPAHGHAARARGRRRRRSRPGTNTLFVVDPPAARGDVSRPGGVGRRTALTTLATARRRSASRATSSSSTATPTSRPPTRRGTATRARRRKANAVAAAIAAKIDAIKTATPSRQVRRPGRRLRPDPRLRRAGPDADRERDRLRLDVREQPVLRRAGHAATSLTDEPYYDTDPVPIDGEQMFVADLIGGRLVETPAQIARAARPLRPRRERPARPIDGLRRGLRLHEGRRDRRRRRPRRDASERRTSGS